MKKGKFQSIVNPYTLYCFSSVESLLAKALNFAELCQFSMQNSVHLANVLLVNPNVNCNLFNYDIALLGYSLFSTNIFSLFQLYKNTKCDYLSYYTLLLYVWFLNLMNL